MAFCENCGSEIREGAKFCPNCGAAGKQARTVMPGDKSGGESVRHQPSVLDQYGKFIGIGLLAFAIIDFFSDPAIVTILLSMAIIGGAIFCFSKKFKLKVFTILALICAVICLACGIGQAAKYGLLSIYKGVKKSTEVIEKTDSKTGATDSDDNKGLFQLDVDDSKTRDVTYGRITFSLPEKYVEQSNSKTNEGIFSTSDDNSYFYIGCIQGSVPGSNFISKEVRTLFTEQFQGTLENLFRVTNISTLNSEYENIAGLKCIVASYSGDLEGTNIICNMVYINDPDVDQTVFGAQFYDAKLENEYGNDFQDFFDSARIGSGPSTSSSGVSGQDSGSDTEQTDTTESYGGVDPELKAFLDSYEAFVDEYVVFMKKYMNDPSNALTMIGEYGEIMQKYEDFAKKVDQYNTDEMSVEDAKYYLEVTNRCTQKMLDIL